MQIVRFDTFGNAILPIGFLYMLKHAPTIDHAYSAPEHLTNKHSSICAQIHSRRSLIHSNLHKHLLGIRDAHFTKKIFIA